MASIKCKMCGGTIDVNNESVVICKFCGLTQTVPQLNSTSDSKQVQSNNEQNTLIATSAKKPRSNFFTTVEEAYAKCTPEQLICEATNEAVTLLNEVIAKMSNGDRILIPILFLGAKLGCAGDGKVSQEERNIADKVFGKVLSNPEMNGIYSNIGAAITDADYNLVSIVTKMGNSIAMPFLKYVFCFAYIDGKFEDDVAEKLDGMFGEVLLKDYFEQAAE